MTEKKTRHIGEPYVEQSTNTESEIRGGIPAYPINGVSLFILNSTPFLIFNHCLEEEHY